MAQWDDLNRELDAWGGRTATLWWRDDDAITVTPALERLLDISAKTGTHVSLSVMPRDADDGLYERVNGHALATVIQHGWSHENHAPEGEHWEEHGPHRPWEAVAGEMREGLARILGFARGLRAYCPPWNRIDPRLLTELPGLGLHGVTTWGPRAAAEPAPGVRAANVHVDIQNWDQGGFLGADAVLDQIVDHLSARREGRVDAFEATGLMTHHTWHDPAGFDFLEELFERTGPHPACRWLDARDAFWG